MRKPLEKTDFDRVEVALEQVGLLNKIKTLPQYLNTILTKEFDSSGTVLSGGETQKLALARVLASDASILVLDEPLSSLDPLAEQEINNIISKLAAQKTVIFISHRLSTTITADMIYYIDKGKIVEWGDHNSLLKSKGKYATMFTAQSKRYFVSQGH